MRWLLVVALLVAATAYALETEHFIVYSDDSNLAKYLEEAYSFYVGKGLKPAPPCQGTKYPVYVDASNPYAGDTEIGDRCIWRIVFKDYTRRLVFHEVAHVFFEYYKHYTQDFWVDEAVPEAMASVATGVYYFPHMYFQEKLYEKNPFALGSERLYDWYKYSAPVAWYLERAGNWADVLTAFSTRQGAASLYVKFLLELAKGVSLGGVTYRPDVEVVEVAPGAVRKYPDLPGYAAVYYSVSVPRGGVLRISVEGGGAGRVVSNVALNRDIVVNNGTLLVAVVNNSSQTSQLTLIFYFSALQIRVLDGVFEGGRVSVRLYAEYNFVRVDGVVKVNGTSVRFVDGVGVYNFTGGLRQYVLVLEYGDSWTYLYLDLSRPVIVVRPATLYLDRGGRGVLNVTISNQNPVAIRCVLSGTGLAFRPVEVFIPRGNSTFRLEFQAVDQPPEKAAVTCGPLSAALDVYRPSYSLYFDLDEWRGVLTAKFGPDVLNYTVADLPANISLRYGGYVAGVVSIQKPTLEVMTSEPRLKGGNVVYTLSISIAGMPSWTKLRGTVKVDRYEGVYTGGTYYLDIPLRPGESRRVEVQVGRLHTAVDVNAPSVKTYVTPIRAVVDGRVVKLFAKVEYSLKVDDYVEIIFENAKADRLPGGFVVLTYSYNDVYVIRYSSLGERYSVNVSLPRPEVSIAMVRGVVTPAWFYGLFNVTVKVCNPSVDARYVVDVGFGALYLYAERGRCASNSTQIKWDAPLNQTFTFKVNTSFGEKTLRLSTPPPQVEPRLKRWLIQGSREVADVALVVKTPPNYTYVIFGREVAGEASLDVEVEAKEGAAVVDYGFGRVKLERPRLLLEARPLAVEVGVPTSLEVMIAVPPGLYVNNTLQIGPSSKPIYVGPGVSVFHVALPGFVGPGFFNLSIAFGPYVNHTTAVAYRIVNLAVHAPSRVPVGVPVSIRVVGRVEPPLDVGVAVDASGCAVGNYLLRLNQSLTFTSNKTCVLKITAHTNTSNAVAEVEWASLRAEVRYVELGRLRGLPIFPARGVSARVLLGDTPVEGQVRIVGDFDRLGLVNFTIYVEYMGVVNKTSFVGFAAPPDSYSAANQTMNLLPADARPYFRYLVERAVATGDWALVDKISRLYSEFPTPFTLAARSLVERALATGKEPNVDAAETLRRVEPVVLGALGGLFLAVLRRGI